MTCEEARTLSDLRLLNRALGRGWSPLLEELRAAECENCGHSRADHDDNPRWPGFCDAPLNLRNVIDARCDCAAFVEPNEPNEEAIIAPLPRRAS